MEQLQQRSFRECTLEFLDDTFALQQAASLPTLDVWLAHATNISDLEQQVLIRYQHGLIFNVHDWNEWELDSHFIGPVFALVDFSSQKFNHYTQRDLAGEVDGWKLAGRPDGMIATGRRAPKKPYFAFQEYKKELDPNGDPAAQALAAMLVGQQQNEAGLPMYGCYVVGSDWRFMTLEGREYAISRDYSGLTQEVFDIFRILKGLKQIVIERAG
jgi:hypothetical protein